MPRMTPVQDQIKYLRDKLLNDMEKFKQRYGIKDVAE